MATTNQMTFYEKVIAMFQNMDLDWRDIEENVEQCSSDDERVRVLILWMDQQAWDEEWKDDLVEAAKSMAGTEEGTKEDLVKSVLAEADQIV